MTGSSHRVGENRALNWIPVNVVARVTESDDFAHATPVNDSMSDGII
jgi:hypothetical protein